ncbi:MAG: hypothetical protein K0R00_136 [Herbinix sp.]|jgi:hypothetical protein|nr:hypothetical protein [Herbinix sp.]
MKIEDRDMSKEAANGTISNPNAMLRPMPAAIPMESNDFPLINEQEDKRDNGGFRITALPAAILGAIIGGAIAKKQSAKMALNQNAAQPSATRRQPSGFEHKNYYDQMNHLSSNMRVIFTPISAVYVVKDGVRDIPLETIEIEEMNEDMYAAWKNKDHQYYKNLLLNKMYSDIRFAEKEFAKRIVENQMDLRKTINKQAFDDLDFEDLTDVELFHYASSAEDFFEKENSAVDKVAEILIESMDDEIEYVLSEANFERPFDKYAGAITDVLKMVPFINKEDRVSSAQGKYLNPSYLKNNVRIGFFPDRVIFIVDGKLVGTLSVMAMNEEGFEHFQERNVTFFEDYFKKEIRKGIARLNEKFPSQNIGQEKTAAATKLKAEDIFVDNNVHPAVYFLLLTAKYGYEWVDFDGHALVSIIEKDFALTRPIGDIALNKVLSVKAANNSDVVFTSPHAFEKIIRSMNGKPVNFLLRETQDLDLEDFVFGLDAINRITPYDNVYDNFSPEVYDYLVKTLADKQNYIWGVNVTGTDEERQFATLLNYSLLSELNKRFTALISTEQEKNDIINENELIFNTSLKLMDAAYEQLSKAPDTNLGEFLRAVLGNSGIDKNISEIIVRQVIKNVVLDTVLDKREFELIGMLTDLGLHNQ